jgi:hypothetical protein
VTPELIAIRRLVCDGREIEVLLFQSDGGRGFARCVLATNDTPIVDGATPEAAFGLVKELLGEMLYARAMNSTSPAAQPPPANGAPTQDEKERGALDRR